MNCTKSQLQVFRQNNLLQTWCRCFLSIRHAHTHTKSRVNSCILFHHCSLTSMKRQPFRPALARKAGQLDPQTPVGSLGAHRVAKHKRTTCNSARHCGSKPGSNLDAAMTDCVLQHHVANPHVSTHLATEHDNNHAAITLRSATKDSTSE